MREPLGGLLEGALSPGGLLGSLVCTELATSLSRRCWWSPARRASCWACCCSRPWRVVHVGAGYHRPHTHGRWCGRVRLAKPLIVLSSHLQAALAGRAACGRPVARHERLPDGLAAARARHEMGLARARRLGATPAVVVVCLALCFGRATSTGTQPPRPRRSAPTRARRAC